MRQWLTRGDLFDLSSKVEVREAVEGAAGVDDEGTGTHPTEIRLKKLVCIIKLGFSATGVFRRFRRFTASVTPLMLEECS